MARNATQIRPQKTAVSKKKLREVKALKRQALEYYQLASNQDLDALTVELRLQQAKSTASLVLKYNPEDSDTLNLFCRIALESGDVSDAKSAITQALDIHPRNGGYWYSFGHVLLAEQNFAEAETCFRKAIKYSAKETKADHFLAYTLQAKGDVVEAFQLYRELAKTQSNDPHIKSKLFECAALVSADYYDSEIEHDLLTYLKWENTNSYQLSSLVCSTLEHKFQLNEAGCSATSEEIASDQLFLQALKKVLIKSGNLEKLVMALRYELLLAVTNQGRVPNTFIDLAVSIACYGNNSEYILPMTDAEKNMTAALKDLCNSALAESSCQPESISGALLMYSMYAPWTRLKDLNKLFGFEDKAWPSYFKELKIRNSILVQLSTIEIKSLSEISSGTSERVKAQYEAFPYPRWQNIDYKRHTHYNLALKQELPNIHFPKYFGEQSLRVMVAGCGTGRHALHVAKYFRNVEVTAIDLSHSSLAYAKLKANEFSVNNIQFYQSDLLKLTRSPVDELFHIIECSGVLHHIKEHHRALDNLLNLLVPGGLIKIALYSERAREPVKQIRNLFKRENTKLEPNRIRMIRQAILSSTDMKGKVQLTESDDFYSMSGTVDLLFHEYETRFTPLSIMRLCEQHELKFMGFSSLSNSVKQQFKELHGKEADFTDLTLWESFEEQHPTTFSAMYQFYCQKS